MFVYTEKKIQCASIVDGNTESKLNSTPPKFLYFLAWSESKQALIFWWGFIAIQWGYPPPPYSYSHHESQTSIAKQTTSWFFLGGKFILCHFIGDTEVGQGQRDHGNGVTNIPVESA